MGNAHRSLHARHALIRHALHQTNVEANLVCGAGAARVCAWAAEAVEAGLEIQGRGSGPHSTTVPSIWKKGRPTLVCQFWGDLRMRLLSVSRIFLER